MPAHEHLRRRITDDGRPVAQRAVGRREERREQVGDGLDGYAVVHAVEVVRAGAAMVHDPTESVGRGVLVRDDRHEPGPGVRGRGCEGFDLADI